MNKKLGIGIVAIVAIVAVAMFTGCVEEETPVHTPSPTPTPTPTPTPLPEPKYSPGDIIAENETTNEDVSTIILDYDPKTDEYKTNIIHKVNGKWLHFGAWGESWEDREYIEKNSPVRIDYVNLSTVMSWDEYWEGGGYEAAHPTPTPMPVEEIKSKAKEVRYNDLMRYNEEWIGEIIHCVGQVVQVMEISEDKYVVRAHVTPKDLKVIWFNYEGKRFLKDDIIDIWGEVKGIKTYESVGAGEISIPEIDVLHIELIVEAGESWGAEKSKIKGYWRRLGYI